MISLKHFMMPCLVFMILSGTLVLWFISHIIPMFGTYEAPLVTPSRCLISAVLPFLVSCYGLKKGSLDFSGTQIGYFIGFIMSMSSYSFMTSLLIFFVAGSNVTKWKSEVKCRYDENFKEGGKRNWLQVICNGGVAAELALLYCIDGGSGELPINFSKYYTSSWLSCSIVGALACSCGDTFASEIGVALGKSNPRLITNLSKVPKGTNGAISFVGLLASILGGFLIGLTFFLSNVLFIDAEILNNSPPQWPIMLLSMCAGFIGSIIDSFLGATLQFSGINKKTGVISEHVGKNVIHVSGIPFFDNNNVNLVSSLLTAILTSIVGYKTFEYCHTHIA